MVNREIDIPKSWHKMLDKDKIDFLIQTERELVKTQTLEHLKQVEEENKKRGK